MRESTGTGLLSIFSCFICCCSFVVVLRALRVNQNKLILLLMYYDCVKVRINDVIVAIDILSTLYCLAIVASLNNFQEPIVNIYEIESNASLHGHRGGLCSHTHTQTQTHTYATLSTLTLDHDQSPQPHVDGLWGHRHTDTSTSCSNNNQELQARGNFTNL